MSQMDGDQAEPFLVFELGFEGVAQALKSIPAQRTTAKQDGPCVHLASENTRLRSAVNVAKRELRAGRSAMAMLALRTVDADPAPGSINGRQIWPYDVEDAR